MPLLSFEVEEGKAGSPRLKRFQAVRLLKVYGFGMEGKIPNPLTITDGGATKWVMEFWMQILESSSASLQTLLAAFLAFFFARLDTRMGLPLQKKTFFFGVYVEKS